MGYLRGALRKENINPAEVMSTGAIWGWAVVVVVVGGWGHGGGGGSANPSSYGLKEMEKTNIWTSAVGGVR